MDASGLHGGRMMEEVVRRHRQVVRVACGHIHRPIHVAWGGTIASTPTHVKLHRPRLHRHFEPSSAERIGAESTSLPAFIRRNDQQRSLRNLCARLCRGSAILNDRFASFTRDVSDQGQNSEKFFCRIDGPQKAETFKSPKLTVSYIVAV